MSLEKKIYDHEGHSHLKGFDIFIQRQEQRGLTSHFFQMLFFPILYGSYVIERINIRRSRKNGYDSLAKKRKTYKR